MNKIGKWCFKCLTDQHIINKVCHNYPLCTEIKSWIRFLWFPRSRCTFPTPNNVQKQYNVFGSMCVSLWKKNIESFLPLSAVTIQQQLNYTQRQSVQSSPLVFLLNAFFACTSVWPADSSAPPASACFPSFLFFGVKENTYASLVESQENSPDTYRAIKVAVRAEEVCESQHDKKHLFIQTFSNDLSENTVSITIWEGVVKKAASKRFLSSWSRVKSWKFSLAWY